jgi:uncharacterized Zn-binding protein involved in type VI secretion
MTNAARHDDERPRLVQGPPRHLRLAGICFPSTNGKARPAVEVDLASDDESVEPRQADAPEDPAASSEPLPVFRDARGRNFVIIPTECGPAAWPIRILRRGSAERIDRGGYISIEDLQRASGGAADHLERANALRRAAVEAALAATTPEQTQETESSSSADTSSGTKPSKFEDAAKSLGEQAVGELLAGAAAGQFGPSLEQLLSTGNLASLGLNQVLSYGAQTLLDGWAIDDSSSMEEQLAHKALTEAVGHLQGMLVEKVMSSDLVTSILGADTVAVASDPSSLADRISKYFTGGPSGPHWPVLRLGDQDAAGNAISSGFPTLRVEGMPVAREMDPVSGKGRMVGFGASTVHVGGLMVACATQSMSSEGPFIVGAANTFVGGPIGGAAPPPPASNADVSAQSAEQGPGSAEAGGATSGVQADRDSEPDSEDAPYPADLVDDELDTEQESGAELSAAVDGDSELTGAAGNSDHDVLPTEGTEEAKKYAEIVLSKSAEVLAKDIANTVLDRLNIGREAAEQLLRKHYGEIRDLAADVLSGRSSPERVASLIRRRLMVEGFAVSTTNLELDLYRDLEQRKLMLERASKIINPILAVDAFGDSERRQRELLARGDKRGAWKDATATSMRFIADVGTTALDRGLKLTLGPSIAVNVFISVGAQRLGEKIGDATFDYVERAANEMKRLGITLRRPRPAAEHTGRVTVEPIGLEKR